MKVDRCAYTDNFEHLRLHLGTEFQLLPKISNLETFANSELFMSHVVCV